MRHSIIGAGQVGSALARQFVRAALPVTIANSRGAGSLVALVTELGPLVTAATLPDALQADLVILAVPFRAHPAVGRARGDWTGTIVIDAMNTYGIEPDELGGRPSSEVVARAFPGARLVRTLNQLPAKLLARDPAEHGGRRVMFVASDDADAAAEVSRLVAQLGFAPLPLGRIDAGGLLLGRGEPLVLQNLIKLDG